MERSWASQIETWNAQIRAGEGFTVAREIGRIPRGKIPLELMAKIANLAWRINRPTLGIRLLFTELRRQNNLKINTHPEAFTEYAACLLEVGALSEAKRILREVQDRAPRSKFYHALLLFKEWDYESACPLLEDYITKIPADYHQIVTRVNLVSAYVNTKKFSQAESLLAELKVELRDKGHWLLFGNCCEIESQIHFQLHQHEQALKCLEQSEKHLENAKNMGWLYCKKWHFINRLYLLCEQGVAIPSEMKLELLGLKKIAQDMHSWETVRELDLHWAVRTQDTHLINHVYFGSPASRYRKTILSLLNEGPNARALNSEYLWMPLKTVERPEQILRLEKSLLESTQGAQSFLMKKLLLTLLSDFYSPFRVGQLFSALFEDEFFDLDTSPDRVFQIIRRLRSWLEVEFPGCQIHSSKRGYALHFAPDCGVLLSRALSELKIQDRSNIHYLFVHENFTDGFFTAAQLSSKLQCSTRSANRVLKDLKSKGQVASQGRGRCTRFKLVS